MFKVNNKIIVNFWTYFPPFCKVSSVNFEQINFTWETALL